MTETRPLPSKLLEPVEVAAIAASSVPFVVKEAFERPQGVQFSTVWTEFKKRYYGKSEGPREAMRLRKYRLLSMAPDAPIIAELGGEARAESTLAAAFALLKLQGKGQDGILQTSGYANIFYSRDLKGVLCAIRIGWDGEGWVVDAIPVDDPLAWNGKHDIFAPCAG